MENVNEIDTVVTKALMSIHKAVGDITRQGEAARQKHVDLDALQAALNAERTEKTHWKDKCLSIEQRMRDILGIQSGGDASSGISITGSIQPNEGEETVAEPARKKGKKSVVEELVGDKPSPLPFKQDFVCSCGKLFITGTPTVAYACHKRLKCPNKDKK